MAYITLEDLKTRDSERSLVSLTDPNGQCIVQGVIDRVIASAEAEVNSYIAGRIKLPLLPAEVSATIKHYTLIVARFYLYADRKTDAVQTEYDQARRWLLDVAAGRAQLGVERDPDPTSTVEGVAVVAPVRKSMFAGDDFSRRYDVPMGPNGSGTWGIG